MTTLYIILYIVLIVPSYRIIKWHKTREFKHWDWEDVYMCFTFFCFWPMGLFFVLIDSINWPSSPPKWL